MLSDINGVTREWDVCNDHGGYCDTGQQFLYIAMELCHNNLLKELKKKSSSSNMDFRRMTSHWLWMAEILQPLCEGLKYLHGKGERTHQTNLARFTFFWPTLSVTFLCTFYSPLRQYFKNKFVNVISGNLFFRRLGFRRCSS